MFLFLFLSRFVGYHRELSKKKYDNLNCARIIKPEIDFGSIY